MFNAKAMVWKRLCVTLPFPVLDQPVAVSCDWMPSVFIICRHRNHVVF